MAIAADTNALSHAIGATGTTQSRAVSITTNLTNNIILAFAHAYNGASGIAGKSFTVSSSGLTWTRRGTLTLGGATFSQLVELWYAVATGTLSAESITATVSGGANVTQVSLACMSINGADLTTPFDVNAALPATVETASGGAHTITFSTTATNTMLVGYECTSAGTPTLWAVPSSWTSVDTNGAVSLNMRSMRLGVTSAQSSQSITGIGGTADALFLDALQEAGGGGGGFFSRYYYDMNGTMNV
jgi:hypothetical protein